MVYDPPSCGLLCFFAKHERSLLFCECPDFVCGKIEFTLHLKILAPFFAIFSAKSDHLQNNEALEKNKSRLKQKAPEAKETAISDIEVKGTKEKEINVCLFRRSWLVKRHDFYPLTALELEKNMCTSSYYGALPAFLRGKWVSSLVSRSAQWFSFFFEEKWSPQYIFQRNYLYMPFRRNCAKCHLAQLFYYWNCALWICSLIPINLSKIRYYSDEWYTSALVQFKVSLFLRTNAPRT